jgi:topoisomerase IV subunit B
MTATYSEDTIRTLDWKEHIRKRPGMYIGKLGDGSSMDDGIYILIKEVLDNSVDEYMMGFGKTIEVTVNEKLVSIRDYGRGIPLGKVEDVASKMNTGAKYDSKVFKKSVGLNGVGIKAVNALSSNFKIQSFRESQVKSIEFSREKFSPRSPSCRPIQPTGPWLCLPRMIRFLASSVSSLNTWKGCSEPTCT